MRNNNNTCMNYSLQNLATALAILLAMLITQNDFICRNVQKPASCDKLAWLSISNASRSITQLNLVTASKIAID
jgi:hypothetical protein